MVFTHLVLFPQNVYVSYVDKDYGHNEASLIPDLEGWKYVMVRRHTKWWSPLLFLQILHKRKRSQDFQEMLREFSFACVRAPIVLLYLYICGTAIQNTWMDEL